MEGASANQAQFWLGHHDPGFTARTYVHLDSDDLPDPAIFDTYFESEHLAMGPTVLDLKTTYVNVGG